MSTVDRHDMLLELGRRHDHLLDELAELNERIETALAENQALRDGEFQ